MDFEQIKKDIEERMARVTSAFQPTHDEISIAWLVCEIERLRLRGAVHAYSRCPNLIRDGAGYFCELTSEDPFEGS